MKNSWCVRACKFIWNRFFFVLSVIGISFWRSCACFLFFFQVEVLTQAPRATTVHAIRFVWNFVCFLMTASKQYLQRTHRANRGLMRPMARKGSMMMMTELIKCKELSRSRSRKSVANSVKRQCCFKFRNRKLSRISKLTCYWPKNQGLCSGR